MAHQVRKRFGQHFLHDPFIISNIIDAIDPQTSDTIIEIGPGLGALTLPLLERCEPNQYIALEIDRDVIAELKKKSVHYQNFSILEANALKQNFLELPLENSPYRVIGNLPYNISTPLIFRLLDFKDNISDMIFMLQKEVIDRMVAKPNSKTYGRLSVMVQAHCQAEHLFDVPPGAFNPPPKVMSAMVKLAPYINHSDRETITNSKLFTDMVRDAFNLRRKTIRNSLKKYLSAEELTQLEFDPRLRAENLSVNDYIKLSNYKNSQIETHTKK